MERERASFGMNGQLPDAGKLLDAQRAALQNATRMGSAACHFAMSMNRSWLNFWNSHISQFTEFPERFAQAQTGFMEEAFDHYQESIEQLSGLAKEAREEVQEAMAEAQKPAEGMMQEMQEMGERAAGQIREEVKDMGKGNRPKESKPQGAGGHQRGAH